MRSSVLYRAFRCAATRGATEEAPQRKSLQGLIFPSTGWLAGWLALDGKGFVKTGAALTVDELVAAKWPLRRQPYLLETSIPGVLAVGDVRSGSTKRVASAVGEGSIAIAAVHQVLAE